MRGTAATPAERPPRAATRSERTFCRLCIANCGIVVTIGGDRVIDVRGDPAHPVSRGYTCSKGRALGAIEGHPGRLDTPRIHDRGGTLDVAPLALVADLARRVDDVIDEHGPGSLAVYLGTGAGSDAAAWAAGGWFARGVGARRYTSLTVDAVAKPYVSELMTGLPSLVPHPDPDADLVVIVGSNPVVSHGHTAALANPVVALRRWARRGGLWVLDPRRTATAALANRHVACRPGTDHVFLGYVLRLLLDGVDRTSIAPRADGVDELASAVGIVERSMVAQVCGVDPAAAEELAVAILSGGTVATQSGTGATMAPAANLTEWLLACLGVVTGSVEHRGGTWFHPGYFGPAAGPRRPSAPAPERPPEDGPPGRRWGQYPSAALPTEIERGEVRALIVVGGNPLTALPGAGGLATLSRRLPVLAVADVVEGPLTDVATHVLPCASQLERPDINKLSELAQPVLVGQYTAALRTPRPNVRPAWWWLAALGEGLGRPILPTGLGLGSSGDEVLDAIGGERVKTARARPLHERGTETIARPWVAGAVAGGRWRLAPRALLAEWHSRMAADGRPAGLSLAPMREVGRVNSVAISGSGSRVLAMNPADAEARGIADGDEIVVESATGALRTTARLDASLRRDAAALPHGHGDCAVNDLTTAESMNGQTGMPSLSGVPITVRRARRERSSDDRCD